MTSSMNPNVLGLLLVFGIFSLLYKLDISKRSSIVFVLFGTGMMFYTIILTASKKSFLATMFSNTLLATSRFRQNDSKCID